MRRILQGATPEVLFIVSAIIGLSIAAVASRFPALGFSFWEALAVMLSVDIAGYVATRLGFMRSLGRRG